MAYIRVAYRKRDGDFDYVPGHRLTALIAREEISHFFRPAEKKWVNIKIDAVRGKGGDEYQGPERRRDDPMSPAAGKEASRKDWLESLWRQVENS